jgi:hypothetical protein
MLMETQRAAELAHPYQDQLPMQTSSPAAPVEVAQQIPLQQPLPAAPQQRPQATPVQFEGDVGLRICAALERIAAKLEEIDIKVVKKKKPRKQTPRVAQ